jgi:peptide/nickel transport system permease protein
MSRLLAMCLLTLSALGVLLAPWIAPHGANERFRDHAYAPPTPVRIIGADGSLRAPFFYPQVLADRLEARYVEDRARPVALRWFTDGRLVAEPAGAPPFLLAGADREGRDVFARFVLGARGSLGIGLAAVALAGLLGLAVGGAAVLPAIYVVVMLRAALPLVLPPATAALMLIGILGSVGAPWVARGVRAIVAAERESAYAEAARALGASGPRVLVRHLLPAAHGYALTQMLILFPALVVAEATLSFVGLGLPDATPSWGTALQEAANVAAISHYPWVLLPAVGVFAVTWSVNVVVADRTRS